MKKVSLWLVITCLTVFAASGQICEERSVSGFTGIDISSVFSVTVSSGETESLTIEAEADVMPYVISEVNDGILHLYVDRRHINFIRSITVIKAFVVMKNLENVSLSGACKLVSNDLFTPESFRSVCSGASSMTVNVHAGELKANVSGACIIQMKASVQGNALVNVSGSSKINMELEAEEVEFHLSGLTVISMSGRATDLKVDITGASSVDAGDFTVKNVTVDSSGASTVTVNASDNLCVNSSGASLISYIGSPAIKNHSSGASRLKAK